MKQQSDALRLADELRTHKQHPRYFFYEAAAAELCRLHQHELSNELWYKKTDWLQNSYTIAEVGMHRADVIKQRIDRLHSLNHELMEALEEVVAYCEEHGHSWSVLVEAKAALAKARGTK